MVRWSEQKEAYLVRVAPAGGGAAFYLISSFSLVATGGLGIHGEPFGAVICGLFSAVFLAIGRSFTGFESWIAVPLRGRCAKWGGHGRQVREGDVARFELGCSAGGPPFVIAHLADGRREIAIGTDAFMLPRDANGLVERLNELLEAGASRRSE